MKLRLLSLVVALGLVAGGMAITAPPVAAATHCSSRSATFKYYNPTLAYFGLGSYYVYVRLTAHGCYNGTTSWGNGTTTYRFSYNVPAPSSPMFYLYEAPPAQSPFYVTTFSPGHGHWTRFYRNPVFGFSYGGLYNLHTLPNINLSQNGTWSYYDAGAGVSGDCTYHNPYYCYFNYGAPAYSPVFISAWWS